MDLRSWIFGLRGFQTGSGAWEADGVPRDHLAGTLGITGLIPLGSRHRYGEVVEAYPKSTSSFSLR
jgi:hypothetical protein